MDAQRLAVSGGAQVGLDAHPEVIALGGLHVLRVGALGGLHLLDGGRLGGGSVARWWGGGCFLAGGGGWFWFWVRIRSDYFTCVVNFLLVYFKFCQRVFPCCQLLLSHVGGEGNCSEEVAIQKRIAIKCRRFCPLKGDAGQARAALKCIVANGGDAARNGDAGQTSAETKCTVTDGGDAVRYVDAGQS